jgi:MscS family membrane protein
VEMAKLDIAVGRESRVLTVGIALAVLCILPCTAIDAAETVNAGLGSAPVSVSRDTPRQSVVGYLSACRAGDLSSAAHYLNLSSIPADEQMRRGQRLARRFKIVLDNELWIDPEELSDDPAGDREDGLPLNTDRLATLPLDGREMDILIERIDSGDGAGYWLVHRSTVAQIDRLYDAFGFGWLGDHLPEIFFSVRIWEVQLWQICAMLLLLAVAWFAARLVAIPLMGALNRTVRRTSAAWDDELATAVTGPLRLGLFALLLFVASGWLSLAEPVEAGLRLFWRLATVLILGWLLSSWVGVGARLLERSIDRVDSVAGNFIPIFARIAKIGVWALVAVVALDAVGVRVMGLIAGLGIGGLAVAFAAQKTIENFFGALSISADQPFAVGDFVEVGSTKGTVEEVGLRSTRLRTLARTRVTIPNGALISERVENFSERDRILFKTTLGLLYDSTAAQLEFVIDEIKKLLLGHPKVYHDTVRVRLAGFGDSAVNVDILTWITTTDFHEYTAAAEELNFAIMRIVERAGTAFAYPSQTVYTSSESGFDEQRARQAETMVTERRQRGELWLPEPPEEA